MSRHHPVTKTPMWKATSKALRKCEPTLAKHTKSLLKQAFDQSPNMPLWQKESLLCLAHLPYFQSLHQRVCKCNGLPLLTWRYV